MPNRYNDDNIDLDNYNDKSVGSVSYDLILVIVYLYLFEIV